MPDWNILFAFLVTTSVFAFIPGPAMLYVAARTIAAGRTAGMMAVLGVHLGSYAHIVAAAAGLSVLFHAVPVVYALVKLAGAIYLIWLGISLFRAKAAGAGDLQAETPRSARKAFAESIVVEVLNPKTAIFFLAFLPQFIDSAASFPVWVQFVVLGLAVSVIFTIADVFAVALAGLVMARLNRSSTAQKLAQRAGGTILVGLGAHLALQRS
ncbi:LysE family translocator [Rhizobium sp. CFBP 13726]|uniref:LysE family translocator n=1 Tax=Rhizobium sp. CFBP 13726 TaxID=2775296 RepID=UPI0017807355|nr:LysE family translocator [Rhizobium sp. CFBP 13726]MBD8649919.1 LysE family translocator [Rhizobium sp. CFBP 13726]